MHLFVDGRMADTAHLHGIARYLYKIVEWGSRHRQQHKISVAARQPERWRALPVEVLPVKSKPFSPLEHWEFYRLLRGRGYDHAFFPSLAAPVWCPIPYSITVHDLIPWHYPRSLLVRLYLSSVARWTVHRARHVLAVSHHTAREIETYLGYPARRVQVIHHGGFEGKPLPPQSPDQPYLLCVTNPKPHKNLATLLQAFRGLEDRCRLIVVSPECPEQPGVEHQRGLSDEELRRLYAGASAAIVPSFLEGFGFPALEAMELGTPLICSNASALPEVAGDAALYFDPHDGQQLRETITELLDHPAQAAQLRQRGLERAQTFRWDRSASQHWDSFEAAAYKV